MTNISDTTGLRRVAARLVWGSLEGPELSSEERRSIEGRLGGVALSARNAATIDEAKALIEDIRRTSPIDVLVALDGHWSFLTQFPSPMAIAATQKPANAYMAAYCAARELLTIGVNLVFGPTLDIASDIYGEGFDTNYFGSDPDIVGDFGSEAIRGWLAGGVIPVAKHFPGIGRLVSEPPSSAPLIQEDEVGLDKDIGPFRRIARINLPAVMTANVRYPVIDPQYPGALSMKVTGGLLRRQLGYEGVVITEDVSTGAMADEWTIEKAAVQAISAGADVVLATGGYTEAIEALADALDNNKLPRLFAFRALQRLQMLEPVASDEPMMPDGSAIATKIARESLTVLWDDDVLPVPKATKIAVVDLPALSGFKTDLLTAIRRELPNVVSVEKADLVIVGCRDAHLQPAQIAVLDSFAAKRTIRVALGSPADLMVGPRPSVGVATFSDSAYSCTALAIALTIGRGHFPGMLPARVLTT